MDAKTLQIMADDAKIDRIATIVVRSLNRAAVENQCGKVVIEVPVHLGEFATPKEVQIIYHNS